MSMFYGDRELALDEDNMNLLLVSLNSLALAKSEVRFSGLPLYTLEETKHRVDSGFVLLGNVDKTALIGVGYLDGINGRVWVFISEGKPTLFIDGSGAVVNKLGFEYNTNDHTVFSPYNNQVVVTL